tara:strand:+ start:3174 stop:7382 length:4209 start_codon:yes stop_codon:yes gene_type:complete
MAQIKNTFLKGKMNQDLDSRIVPNGEYREAINLQISRSESDTVGEFENVLGNLELFDVGGGTKIIGYVTNESENLIYVFATNYDNAAGVRAPNGSNMGIFRYDVDSNNLTTLVTGHFLNFNQSFPIHGANLVQELLFFTDNLNQPRRINVTKAYNDSNHYSSEDQISVAKFYPWDKIKIYQQYRTALNGAVTNTNTIVISGDTSNIQVGDVLVNHDRGTDFDAVNDITDLIKVIGIANSTTVILSKNVTIANAAENIDFLRVTAQNKSNPYLDNFVETTISAGDINNAAKTIVFQMSATNPIPKVGDLVVCTAPPGEVSNIPAGTSIVDISAAFAGVGTTHEYTITLSKTPTFAQPSPQVDIRIGDNPFYDASWKGDAALLDDKFVRFSYRFQFEDNEYSLMAPFSQPVFIPKQDSQFGAGPKTDPSKGPLIGDMDNTYKSTIISWFENNVDNIKLRIPVYYRFPSTLQTTLKVKAIDVLYKESDALAVKVLDTVELSSLNQSTDFSNMRPDDLIYGDINWYYYEYQYKSSKPYKTLPESQTTRVYDKVPIKALAQELISNRVVYGNYVDKHTAPTSIDYSVSVQEKSAKFNNIVEYPYHTLKHNRTYQVGFVLADRYGRQSDVILSSFDNNPTTEGSTVFAPYKTRAEAASGGAEPVFDWIGDALNIRLNTQIGVIANPPSAAGEPGIYSANNPLGWYSYKIVVKQQEQEYYNVYLPGFVSGDPIKTGNTEQEKYAYSILLSDNINKVPRDLQEVGPNDTDFASSETLTIRVNNPNINNSATRPAGFPQTDAGWNNQYYPNFLSQEVLAIGTVRDLEVAAIPFVADAPEGTYGATGTLTAGNNVTPVSIGSIPWGPSPGVQPFYNSDLNPFVMKFDTTENGGTPILGGSTVPGQVGAECSANNPGSGQKLITMQPFLSIAETKPSFSRLGLFYATNQVGLISKLNEVINAQFGGAVDTEVSNLDFGENSAPNQQLGVWNDVAETTTGTNWNFLDGSGSQITTGTITASILQVVDQTGADRTNENLFRLAGPVGANKEFQIFTNSAAQGTADKYFWYSTSSADPGNSTDIYTFTFTVDYNDGITDYNSTVSGLTATLQNCVPTFGNCSNPPAGSITTGSTTIKTFTGGTNGSVDTTGNPANNTRELVYSLDPSNSAAIQNIFSVSSAGVLTAGVGQLVQNTTYTVVTRLTDVAGNGEHSTCSITFTAGTQHVPQAICNGQQGAAQADCGESIQYLFLKTATNPAGSDVISNSLFLTGNGVSENYIPGSTTIKRYNVRANAAAGSNTGALTQGVMRLQPTLTVTGGTGTATTFVSLQYRTINPTGSWTNATDTAGNTIQYNQQLSASNGFPMSVTYDVDAVGEYRIFNNRVGGEPCGGAGAANFKVVFGDATYGNSNCSAGPL